MNSEFSAVFYGLASGFSWGAADFGGGFVSRQARVFSVMFSTQLIEVVLLVSLGLAMQESMPPLKNVFWGTLLGFCGIIGGTALYRGLSEGSMGVVAPVSALATGGLPVIFSMMTEGLPSFQQSIGLACAPIAIWLLSSSEGITIRWRDVAFGLTAGVGFGLGFICVDRLQPGYTFYSLLIGRAASIVIILLIMLMTAQREVPAGRLLPIIAIIATFNVGGNTMFVLATQNGRLDISSVLASLYPAVTVLLAWLILHERLSSRQWTGAGAAFVAITLVAA